LLGAAALAWRVARCHVPSPPFAAVAGQSLVQIIPI
jgi:hypothetical protein